MWPKSSISGAIRAITSELKLLITTSGAVSKIIFEKNLKIWHKSINNEWFPCGTLKSFSLKVLIIHINIDQTLTLTPQRSLKENRSASGRSQSQDKGPVNVYQRFLPDFSKQSWIFNGRSCVNKFITVFRHQMLIKLGMISLEPKIGQCQYGNG